MKPVSPASDAAPQLTGCATARNAGVCYSSGRNLSLGLLACLVLVVGSAVYVLDRGSGSIAFLPPGWTGVGHPGAVFGPVGQWLPSLAHSFAFGLLLGIWPRRQSLRVMACLAWTLIAVAFELGQLPAVSHAAGALLAGPLSQLPFAEAVSASLRHGRFDLLDLVATLVGGALAIGLLIRSPDLPRRTAPGLHLFQSTLKAHR